MKKFILLVPIFLFVMTGCGKNEYYCLKGYILDEENKSCTRLVVEDAKINYYCKEKNETLEGDKCKKANVSQATPKKVCNPGFYVEGSLCAKDGTSANISKCGSARTYDSRTDQCYDKIPAVTTYECEDGKADGSTCVVFTYSDALIEYVCDDPKYKVTSDNKCEYKITMKASNTKQD